MGIIAALLISGAMLGAAFWLSSPARMASAVSTEELLRAYAVKDADQDGLPDWQEALYGTDPADPRSIDPSMTDAEAVAQGLVEPRFSADPDAGAELSTEVPGVDAAPQTVTDRFGKRFLENYLRMSQGAPMSDEELAAFIEAAVKELAEERADRFALSDLSVGERGREALLSYAAAMDATLVAKSAERDEKSVYDHFADFVTGVETERSLARIGELADAYEASADAVMTLSVPPEVSAQHLDFANAYAALGEVTADMAAMNADPLRGLLGLVAYDGAWNRFSDALATMGKTLAEQLDY